MTTVGQDLRYAFRTFAKSPGFTLAVIVTLALGISANTIVFSAVYGMWFKPLDYPDADRLAFLFSSNSALVAANPTEGWDRSNVSANDFYDWRAQSRSFVDMGICRYATYNLTGTDRSERVIMARASASLLPTLGYDAMLGRAFTEEEDRPGHDRVLLLSSRYWEHRFGGDPAVVGTSILLDDIPYTVLGVLPRALDVAWGRFPGVWEYFDVWAPFAFCPNDFDRTDRSFRAIGRLRPDVTMAAAQSEMTGIAAQLAAAYPQSNRDSSVNVMSMVDGLLGPEGKSALLTLSLAVAFVLLIACVNVANLLLARANIREQEFAIRSALGAGRGRLARQLLTEAAALAAMGGVVGALFAVWGIDVLVRALPDAVPRKDHIVADGAMLLFTIAVSVIVALVVGLAPAMKSSAAAERLKEGGRAVSASRWKRFGADLLVVGQVSLALALVSCAALMVKSFLNMRELDPGFNARNLLTMRTSLPERRYATAEQRRSFFESVLTNVRAVPEVDAVAAVSTLPCDGLDTWSRCSVEDHPPLDPNEALLVGTVVVTPDYFEVMEIPVLRGRSFTEADGPDAEQVVVVSQKFAQHYWPDSNPIGKRLKYGGQDSDNPWRTVIGVVAPIKQTGFGREARLETYRPYAQSPHREMTIVARTNTAPRAAWLPVEAAIRNVDPDQAIYRVRTMEEVVYREVGPLGAVAGLLGGFALVALALASVGLYGLMTYTVSGRTREIGVRMALGAQSRDVLRLILRRSLELTLVGVLAGVAAAVVLGRTLEALVFGLSPSDPTTLVEATVVLALVALLASYIPARRATMVDPVHALRAE